MKRKITYTFILFCILYISPSLSAQNITFDYDAAGNCILKYKTVTLVSHIKSGGSGNNSSDSIQQQPQKEMIGEREVSIYPNPTQGALKIEIKGTPIESPIYFYISDINGRILAQKESPDALYTYDMTSYPKGVYLLRVVIDGKKKEWKIIKE